MDLGIDSGCKSNKFVAADGGGSGKPSAFASGRKCIADYICKREEDLITLLMSVDIVDQLKGVKVDHHKASGLFRTHL